MQITIEISEEQAARAAELGLTPEAYVRDLLSRNASQDEWEGAWIEEAKQRSTALDNASAKAIAWEEIESRLRARIAG